MISLILFRTGYVVHHHIIQPVSCARVSCILFVKSTVLCQTPSFIVYCTCLVVQLHLVRGKTRGKPDCQNIQHREMWVLNLRTHTMLHCIFRIYNVWDLPLCDLFKKFAEETFGASFWLKGFHILLNLPLLHVNIIMLCFDAIVHVSFWIYIHEPHFVNFRKHSGEYPVSEAKLNWNRNVINLTQNIQLF